MDQTADQPDAAIRVVGPIAVFFVHLVVLLLLVGQFGSIVPKYKAFFEVLEVTIPTATEQVIRLSDLVANYWYLVVLLGAFADGGMVILIATLASKRRWVLSLYSHTVILTAIIIVIWANVVLCFPIYKLSFVLR